MNRLVLLSVIMIVSAGCTTNDPCSSDSGASWEMLPRYAPASPTSGFASAWTGHELVVWGGENSFGDVIGTGGRYEPRANRWNPITTNGAPSARVGASSVWTGSELIVWGGKNQTTDLGDGSRYDPALDRWTPISMVGAPRERHRALAFWTGSEMLVVGGYWGVHTVVEYPNRYDDGALYNPITDAWRPVDRSSIGIYTPLAKNVSAAWTGTELIFWGERNNVSGEDDSPGRAYSPSTGTWRKISTTNAPPEQQPAVMTARGDGILVWGVPLGVDGQDGSAGAVYDPGADAWTTLPAVDFGSITSVLAGDRLVVTDSGWLVDPDTGTLTEGPSFPVTDAYWTPLAWTGTETIGWSVNVYGDREPVGARLTTCSGK